MPEEKPFDASAARLAKAKNDGDLPRSQDINIVVSLACASLATFTVLDIAAAAARVAFAQAVSPRAWTPWPYAALAAVALAVLASALGGALVATFAQAGTLTFKFPAPKFEKLNPFEGLKRMSSRDAVLGGAKASVVTIAVTCATIPAGRSAFAANGATSSPAELAALVVHALQGILGGALAVAALFAVGDVFLERTKWKRRLRMSFEELRRDHKASEGDPLLRGRRRQAHRALVRGSLARVRDAAFVVTNPTHVAIALEYRPPEVAVPRVLVRAVDAGAREVKRCARRLRIPIVENVALARSLLATTDAGEYIPSTAYGAVAAIVAVLVAERALA